MPYEQNVRRILPGQKLIERDVVNTVTEEAPAQCSLPGKGRAPFACCLSTLVRMHYVIVAN